MSDIIAFKIKSKFAHFRDITTNSSRLSYPFPPRTTIEGYLSSLIGAEVFSGLWSPELCDIAIEIVSDNVCEITTYNFSKYDGKKPRIDEGTPVHTQIPVELIKNKNEGYVEFCIYLRHKFDWVTKFVEDCIVNGVSSNYCYMGVSSYKAMNEFVGRFSDYSTENIEEVVIDTIVPIHNISSLDYEKDYDDERQVSRKKVQRLLNKDRSLKSIEQYVYGTNGKGVYVKDGNGKYTSINGKNIVWA
jgi:CRISPR-associated protein Cas5, N-terminal domain